MLTLTDVSAGYSKVEVLSDISLELRQGQVGVVLGANGAGKSTLLKTVSGLVGFARGRVVLDDEDDISGVPAHQRVRRGLAHVLEGHRVFGNQSVRANLLLGAKPLGRGRKDEVAADLEAQVARFPVLGRRMGQIAGSLSGGEQQMLSIGVALMSRPKLLLLDEPSVGLAPKLVGDVFELVTQLKHEGLTILLSEQLAAQAVDVADMAWVLRQGRVAASGRAGEILDASQLHEAYLGASSASGE